MICNPRIHRVGKSPWYAVTCPNHPELDDRVRGHRNARLAAEEHRQLMAQYDDTPRDGQA